MPEAEAERDHDALHVGALAAAVSIVFFRNFYQQSAILLYGDAVAHIHIARRVFDSITPGPLRLGTVWLPLPHILMMPFVVSDWMWRTGVGGSIVSMIAYVAGTVGVFRLVRARTSSAAGWLAAAIYALNPNLIYLQATAMTESLYLALFIWAVVFLDETVRPAEPEQIPERARSLERAAILLAAAMLTRYDGWWLAGCALAAAFFLMAFLVLKRPSAAREFFSGLHYRPMRRGLRNAVLLLAAIPALWLAYNHREYGNSLEFANGPYSARAIEQRTLPASWRHPGEHNPRVAALYFLKSVELNLGDGRWQWPLFAAAVVGLADLVRRRATLRRVVAVVASAAVLHTLHRLWQRAAVRSCLVAVRRVQRPLWSRDAARRRRLCRSHVRDSAARQRPIRLAGGDRSGGHCHARGQLHLRVESDAGLDPGSGGQLAHPHPVRARAGRRAAPPSPLGAPVDVHRRACWGVATGRHPSAARGE